MDRRHLPLTALAGILTAPLAVETQQADAEIQAHAIPYRDA
jgi:hypothetical protein